MSTEVNPAAAKPRLNEKQFGFLKVVYDQEVARMGILIERGKTFLSVITLYFAAFTWKVVDLEGFSKSNLCVRLLLLGTGLLLLGALIHTVQSLKVLPGERILNLEEVAKKLIDAPVDDSDFWEARAVDLSVALKRNAGCNDERAKFLSCAHRFLVLAVVFHLLAFTIYALTI